MLLDNGKLVKNYSNRKLSEACFFDLLTPVPFEKAWNWQKEWRKCLLEEPQYPQAVWLLEHFACYTLGRGGDEGNLLFDKTKPPFDLFRIDRGGEITHHLPGQLVVYLVLDLRRHKTDLNWYLRQLEQVLIDVLDVLGLKGERIPGLTGVWLERCKVASIGVGCRRWITQHGLSLNVDCDLTGFKEIVPCGLAGHNLGKLTSWIPGLTVEEVKPLVRHCLGERFELVWSSREQLVDS